MCPEPAYAPTATAPTAPGRPTPPAGEATLPLDAAGLAMPVQVGRYRIRGLLGAGGMGVVLEAHDPDLDRVVAVKILHGSAATARSTRLTREARAMARLSHPNVVSVYEVGTIDAQIFIAMERIRGITMRAWIEAAPRGWRTVVATAIGAGRGLAAAHEVGIIHCDFKPDNVLISDDGRARVTDFGIATHADGDGDARGDGAEPVEGVAGTPAYMAPEQWRGHRVDARTDQFAFCVTLWEALHGQRPFAATDTERGRIATERGAVHAPRRGVPRWLTHALRRGMAAEPSARWPSLAVLLDHLERRLRRRRWLAIAGAGALGAALSAALAPMMSTRPPPAGAACARAGDEWARDWSSTRRATIERGFTAVADLGPAIWPRVSRAVDDWGVAWTRRRREVCEATEVRHEQSPALLDLRMQCLDRQRRQMAALLGEFSNAIATTVATAPEAIDRLEPLAACDETERLTALAPPPGGAVDAIARIHTELAAIQAAAQVERSAGVVARAEAALAEARTLGYPRLEAEALFALGTILDVDGQLAAAATQLEAAALVADRAADDRLRAQAWTLAVLVYGSKLHQLTPALRARDQAEAALARLRAPDDLTLDLREHTAGALWAGGQAEDGLREVDAVLAQLDPVSSPRRFAEATATRGLLLHHLRRYDESAAAARRALAMFETTLGPDSPVVARQLSNLQIALSDLPNPDYPALEAMLRRAAAIAERAYGPVHPYLANYLNNIVNLAIQTERFDEAIALGRRVIAIREQVLPPDHAYTARAVLQVAIALSESGRADEAEPLMQRGLAMQARGLAPGHTDRGYAMHLHGRNLLRLDRAADAVGAFASAIAVYTTSLGADTPFITELMAWHARALAESGQPRRGLAIADAALTRTVAEGDPLTAAVVHGHRAIALARLGRVAEARAELDRTIASLAEPGSLDRDVIRKRLEAIRRGI